MVRIHGKMETGTAKHYYLDPQWSMKKQNITLEHRTSTKTNESATEEGQCDRC